MSVSTPTPLTLHNFNFGGFTLTETTCPPYSVGSRSRLVHRYLCNYVTPYLASFPLVMGGGENVGKCSFLLW